MVIVMVQFNVIGNVIDGSGEFLIGVFIIVKGFIIGIVIDFNGDFNLNVKGECVVFLFFYIGFVFQEIEVILDNNCLNVILEEDIVDFEEVVVMGFVFGVKCFNLVNNVFIILSQEFIEVIIQ